MAAKEHVVLLVAFSGSDIGLGHLSRMKYLRSRLQNLFGLDVFALFIVQAAPRLRSVSFANHDDVQMVPLLQKALAEIAKTRASAVVLDLPWKKLTVAQINAFVDSIPTGVAITCIDGPCVELSRPVRQIFPSVGKPVGVRAGVSAEWGPPWAFAARRRPHWTWESGNDWILLSGSTNLQKYLDIFISHLETDKHSPVKFRWAMGPFSSRSLQKAAHKVGLNPIRPKEFRKAQHEASYSICRFGVSAIEMMALGIPTIILPGWDRSERGEIDAIRDGGLGLVLDELSGLGTSVRGLIHDERKGGEMSRRCLDTFGAPTATQLRGALGLS